MGIVRSIPDTNPRGNDRSSHGPEEPRPADPVAVAEEVMLAEEAAPAPMAPVGVDGPLYDFVEGAVLAQIAHESMTSTVGMTVLGV